MSDRIIVTSQAEMDKVPQGYDGIVEVRSNPGVWIDIPSGLYVLAYDSSRVVAFGPSRVVAYDSSRVVAFGSSRVVAYDSSQVVAYDSSQVEAYDSSRVVAYDSSRVVARGCAQIVRLSPQANLTVAGNARVVEPPKTAQEYADYYGIEVRDGTAIMYKAVDANLRAFYDQKVQYKVGETITSECNPSRDVECSTGLHVAHKDWAIRFGMGQASDFRLLEVAVPLDKIVVPKNTDGKVRTSQLTVLREVPREEWGFYSTWRM